MAAKQYVGERQTSEADLVRLWNWLRSRDYLTNYHARLIFDYVDRRFDPKGNPDA